MLTNAQRAHDLAIAIIKTKVDFAIANEILATIKNQKTGVDIKIDFMELYDEAYEMSLDSFSARFK